ncbi:MAG: class II glutamine amidotransferase [Actinomycetes bacterium]|jgi:predicted glutamine amidotransferase
MCRLMGYVSTREITIEEIAGANFQEFSDLSAKHRDGWGIATSSTGKPANLIVETLPAKDSQQYAQQTKEVRSDGTLLHLRWATSGLAVVEGNTHPFEFENMSFIHNGGITPLDSMDEFIANDLFPLMRGNTDSEKYFYLLVTQIRNLGLIAGVEAGLKLIKDNCNYSSINAMLLTADTYLIINEHNYEKRPKGEAQDYYDLFYRKDEKGILVASSGWNQKNWTSLENHKIFVVDRKSLNLEVLSV